MVRFTFCLFVCMALLSGAGCNKRANGGGGGGGGGVDVGNLIRLDRLMMENERALQNGF